MPREDRRIFFDYGETYKAIYALCVQKDMKKPPPGVVKAITAHPDDKTQIVIKIENPQTNESGELTLSRDFLAASLMLFCRTCQIPLPKSAQKSVELGADNVILRVIV